MTTELRRLRNYIDGEFRDAADGRTTEVVNPATGEVYATAPLSGAADVDAAMAAAAAAFPAWRDTTPAERQKALLKIADAFEERAEELIAAECENTGKPLGLTRQEEMPPMVDQIRFFAGAARMLEGQSAGEYMEGMTSIVRREPVGVCAQVAPWNYPMMMAVWKFAPALAAGNTVVLKPSDTTPASTVLMAEIIGEILPKGVFNVVCGDRDTGRLDGRAPDAGDGFDHRFRACGHAGRRVARPRTSSASTWSWAARRPVVVFEDADIAKAVEGIRVGGLLQRRPGLHGGDPRARAGGRPRRVRRGAGQGRRRDEDRAAGRRGRALRPAQQPEPAGAGHRLHRASPRPRQGRGGRSPGR